MHSYLSCFNMAQLQLSCTWIHSCMLSCQTHSYTLLVKQPDKVCLTCNGTSLDLDGKVVQEAIQNESTKTEAEGKKCLQTIFPQMENRSFPTIVFLDESFIKV